MKDDEEQGRFESLDALLGDLEGAVMAIVWQHDEVSVRQVHEALEDRDLAYTTVMTIMSRLAEKGVLERHKEGRAYIYRPAHRGKRGFLRQQARHRVRALLDQFGGLAVVELVDELRASPEQMRALEALLSETGDSQEEPAP